MKTKFKQLFQSRATLLITSFLVGCFAHYAVTSELFASDKKISKIKILKIENEGDIKGVIDKRIEKHFELMQKMQENWMSGNSFSGLSLVSPNEYELKISESEDDRYKYIVIDTQDIKKDSLKIDIKDGMVYIESEIKKTNKSERDQTKSYSSFSSSFSRSFNVPEGVDQTKAEIINVDDKPNSITIKFPKYKLTS